MGTEQHHSDVMQQMEKLLAIMARLRDPEGGCPWDIEQSFNSIAPYTLEEAYEVADAIERNDMAALKEELGDLLLQVVFHSQMAKEAGLFDFEAVAAGIAEKMVTRHPHVFPVASGQSSVISNAQDQINNWENLKAAEKKAKGQQSVLDDIPLGFPALTRAEKLTKKAARTGFDWPDITGVFNKLEEEIAELKEAIAE
jgi:MazG family protein